MINTDKYEGHTPAPWIHDMCYENGIIMAGEERITIVQSRDLEPTLANGFDNIPHDVAVANIHLIADAPLILEAYKELRSIIDYIREVGKMDRKPSGHLLSIMEKVLTTEEYLEWRKK